MFPEKAGILALTKDNGMHYRPQGAFKEVAGSPGNLELLGGDYVLLLFACLGPAAH